MAMHSVARQLNGMEWLPRVLGLDPSTSQPAKQT